MEELQDHIHQLESQLQAERERGAQSTDEATQLKSRLQQLSTKTETAKVQPIYVSSSRKLERFRDKPTSDSGLSIQEWVEDMRSQLLTRKLRSEEGAAFLLDHLSGKARQEVLGRGDRISRDTEQIFTVLLRVFGDGDSLAAVLQKFFSCKQGEKEDLLSTSLRLVEIYDRICQLDSTHRPCRNSTLKGRLAEAVRDEGLQREMRRLNLESPNLDFFEMRDRTIDWLGHPSGNTPKKVSVNEVASDRELLTLLRRQGEQLDKQQQQIDELLKRKSYPRRDVPGRDKTVRACYRCHSTTHLIRDCTAPKETSNIQKDGNFGKHTSKTGFLVAPTATSQAAGVGEECGSTLNGIVAECPEVTITVMGTNVKRIIDTGAQVSTLTEAYYNHH